MALGKIAATLIATQIFTASAANAANFNDISSTGTASSQTGAFAGARMRISLGGKRHVEAARFHAGLSIAPVRQTVSADGSRINTSYSTGLEFGFASNQPVGFSLAGQPLSLEKNAKRLGISTTGKIAIGVGVAVLVYVAVIGVRNQIALDNEDE